MKVCPECGKENEMNRLYCNSCGESLKNAQIITGTSEAPAYVKEARKLEALPAANYNRPVVKTNPVPISNQPQPVAIVDFQIPFWSLVKLLVKIALAAIPAAIILSGTVAIIMAILGMIGLGLNGG